MTALMPGWATDELLEEWPESSPSPPPTINHLPVVPSAAKVNIDSVRAKRGSLRMLGQAAARPLPPSRSASSASITSGDGSAMRIVSGHVDGGRGHMSGTGLDGGILSPPSSRSSSGAHECEEPAAGTFLVKEGVEDDRGGHLARNGIGPKGKDIFGALPLERMFDPPSPPVVVSNGKSYPTGSGSPSPAVSTPTPAPNSANLPRKASHQYAPPVPSRLSKSVTPSSNDSFNTSSTSSPSVSTTPVLAPGEIDAEGDDSLLRDSTIIRSDADDSALPGDFVTAQQGEDGEREYEQDREDPPSSSQSPQCQRQASPFSHAGNSYPFTFESPRHPSVSSVGDHYRDEQSPFEPDLNAAAEGPSHSTLNFRSRPGPYQQQLAAQQPVNPALRLFRSTYDTYTREHLSAMVDSIAIEPSPSPPSVPSVRGLRDWSPAADNSADPSHVASSSRSQSTSTPSDMSDARSSKRLRLSPASPPPRKMSMRDWGAHGRAMMDKLRNVEASTDAASTSRASTSDAHEMTSREGPTFDYANMMSPTPPLETALPQTANTSSQKNSADRQIHRSNPSTTSSGYLRAAEDIMARIKQRNVSGSASDSPMVHDRRVLSESDDNRVWEEQAELYAKSKGKARTGPSPRRMLRRLSASEEVKRAAEEDSASSDSATDDESPHSHLEQRRLTSQSQSPSVVNEGAPTVPQASRFTADDINRYMSSSTHATSTTVSTSFVKHRGPRAAPTPHHMRMIRPDDVQDVLPDRIGKMRYDRAGMKWVRELGPVDEAGESRLTGSEESVDVFAGMESLPVADRSRSQTPAVTAADDFETSVREYAQEVGENADDEGTPLQQMQSFLTSPTSSEDKDADFQHPQPQHYVDYTAGLGREESSDSGSLSDVDEPTLGPADRSTTHGNSQQFESPVRPTIHHAASAPAMMTPTPSAFAPKPIRSALRGGSSATPAPGPKKRQGWSDETPGPAIRGITPASSGKRSVSFSDGRRAGKIVDLEVEVTNARWTARVEDDDGDLFKGDATNGEKSFLPSARTKRIQGLLTNMGDLSLADETPSKPSTRQGDRSERPSSRLSTGASSDSDSTVPIRSFRASRSFMRQSRNTADATFLTECSFGVAHDKLVEIITDVEPFNPHWEDLKIINLKGKGADSVARLKEFLPNLDQVNLDDNDIGYLSGIPSSVRTLHVAGNRLSSLTSVNHLRDLQYLDISRNQLDSVAQLECLVHLRELSIDNNAISDLGSILNMDCLIKLSCANNKIERLDLSEAKWAKLESLNLTNNNIRVVNDLHKLNSVVSINLDGNKLDSIAPSRAMPNVRVLRFSDNNVSRFNISLFPKLRTLYADNNLLTHITRPDHGPSSRLENLSLRNQRSASLHLTFTDLENVRRLYISGNPIGDDFFPPRPLYSLVYLEAAACKITSWPRDFSRNMPHMKMLNLNYNYLVDLDGVRGMKELRKLTLVGGRLGGEENVMGRDAMSGLSGLESLEELDLRMNPSTLSYYFPLLLPAPPSSSVLDPSSALSKSSVVSECAPKPLGAPALVWHTYDTRFRKNLPDEWYSKRLVYRGLIMQVCRGIQRLDGIAVEDGERTKAERLLKAAVASRRG